MPKVAVCSICSNNFLAHARVLFASVRRFHPDWDCHLLLADEAPPQPIKTEFFSVTEARELPIADFEKMAFRYDVIEMNVALKPFLINHLLAQGYERVIYLDVDIMIYSPLATISDALDSAAIVVTPHITTPLPSDSGPTIREDLFLKNGTYNLGFIAVSNDPEARVFLSWWSERCRTQGFREPETGLFVDQKWINLVPGLFRSVAILRHPGCNMAYWNLHERRLSGVKVNDTFPLVFFHFSGLDLDAIESISKHQARYNLANRPDVAPLFMEYRAAVISAGHEIFKNSPYHYGRFDNGDEIGLTARRLYDSVQDHYPHPFTSGSGTYHERVRRSGLISKTPTSTYTASEGRTRGRAINSLLRITARLLGIARYEALMTYLRYIGVVRRQDFLLR